MTVKQEMINKGKLTCDGRNKQGLFYEESGVECMPDNMTEGEERRYTTEWLKRTG